LAGIDGGATLGSAMNADLHERIDELEKRLQAFALELHALRRVAMEQASSASASSATAAMPPPPTVPTAPPAPAPARPATSRSAPAPAATPAPRRVRRSRPTIGDLIARLDLFGPRGLAVAGGVVTLLGIVFFFVLAANRGWIGAAERVGFAFAASLLAFVAGVVVRYRFGQLHAAVAAVGAGIAGAYATLAAAAVLYGLLPPAAALPCAVLIAAAGLAIALLWSSELLAGLGLLGASLSPAALALDDGVSAAGTAFAIVVLVAIAAVTVRWAWVRLLVAGIVATLAQVAWTVAAAGPGDGGATAVAAATVLVLVATSAAWQWWHGRAALGAIAAGLAGSGVGVALSSTVALYPDGTDQALVLLGYAAAFALACAAVTRPMVELGYVLGAGALALAGVASTDLLTGSSLALVFAAEAILASVVAHRLRERRFQLGALVYLGLALWQAFETQVAFGRGDGAAAVSAAGLVGCAVAALAVGLFAPVQARERRVEGLLGLLEPLLAWLGGNRVALRASLAWLGFGLVALATDDVLSGAWLAVAYAGGAATLALGGWRLGEVRLAPFAFASAALAAVHAVTLDAPLLPDLYPSLSAGTSGAAALTSAAAAVALCALLLPRRQRGVTWLGPLAGVETRLDRLRVQRDSVVSALGAAAVALGLAVSALWLVVAFGDAGHVAAVVLWSAAGLSVVVLATPRGGFALVVPACFLLVVTLAKAALYDWPELGADQGALEMLVSSAAILLAGWLLRARSASTARVTIASAVAASVSLVASASAIGELVVSDRLAGVAMIAVAAVYAALAAVAQREPRLRNLSTAMWVPGLLALLLGGALVLESRGIVVAYAATSVALASLGRRIDERRLLVAGLATIAGTSVVTVVALTPPTHLLAASATPGSSVWALAACGAGIGAIAALFTGAVGRRLAWSAGGIGLYVASLVILEVAQRLSTASVQTDFERGHTAVSAFWGAIGLGLLVAGLMRRSRSLRLGGLALFGVSLAKLFLYDLSTLSSITRAFSFLAVGGLLLAGGFFLQRLDSRLDERPDPPAPAL
jgi:uncharacterized membrane protein